MVSWWTGRREHHNIYTYSYLSTFLSIYISICQLIYISIYLFINFLKTCLNLYVLKGILRFTATTIVLVFHKPIIFVPLKIIFNIQRHFITFLKSNFSFHFIDFLSIAILCIPHTFIKVFKGSTFCKGGYKTLFWTCYGATSKKRGTFSWAPR